MDFSLSDEQHEVATLAARILAEQTTADSLRLVEDASEPTFDRALWSKLAGAGLLGVAISEADGGLGFGFLELCLVLEELGRTVAPVPLLPTLAGGALPLARFGSPEQRRAILPAVTRGELVLTAALTEPSADPLRPGVTACQVGSGWVLDGAKTCVAAGMIADRLLVSAATGGGACGLFLVDPSAAGVTRRRQDTIADSVEAAVEFDGVELGDQALVGPADANGTALGWLVDHLTVAVSAVMVGITDAALRLTADYITKREQFGRALATFQAVGQRAADAFVDTWAVRLTTLQAAWALADGRPAAKEVALAKLYAAEAGQRVMRAAQHLHGGVGMDRDYPLHRYTLRAKELELTLGGAGRQLEALGRLMADEPVEPAEAR